MVNVDATIMLERPKLLEHKPAMRANIAESARHSNPNV